MQGLRAQWLLLEVTDTQDWAWAQQGNVGFVFRALCVFDPILRSCSGDQTWDVRDRTKVSIVQGKSPTCGAKAFWSGGGLGEGDRVCFLCSHSCASSAKKRDGGGHLAWASVK